MDVYHCLQAQPDRKANLDTQALPVAPEQLDTPEPPDVPVLPAALVLLAQPDTPGLLAIRVPLDTLAQRVTPALLDIPEPPAGQAVLAQQAGPAPKEMPAQEDCSPANPL